MGSWCGLLEEFSQIRKRHLGPGWAVQGLEHMLCMHMLVVQSSQPHGPPSTTGSDPEHHGVWLKKKRNEKKKSPEAHEERPIVPFLPFRLGLGCVKRWWVSRGSHPVTLGHQPEDKLLPYCCWWWGGWVGAMSLLLCGNYRCQTHPRSLISRCLLNKQSKWLKSKLWHWRLWHDPYGLNGFGLLSETPRVRLVRPPMMLLAPIPWTQSSASLSFPV